MKVLELDETIDERTSFDVRFSGLLPNVSGCYCISNIYEEVLYIGQTIDLRRRMSEHLSDPRMTGKTAQGLPSWFHCKQVHPKKLDQVEGSLLSAYKYSEGDLPALNRLGP